MGSFIDDATYNIALSPSTCPFFWSSFASARTPGKLSLLEEGSKIMRQQQTPRLKQANVNSVARLRLLILTAFQHFQPLGISLFHSILSQLLQLLCILSRLLPLTVCIMIQTTELATPPLDEKERALHRRNRLQKSALKI